MNNRRRITKRRLDVIALLVMGMSSKEIGRKLDMATRTVDDHRRKIFAMMNVRNAVELTLKIHGIAPTEAEKYERINSVVRHASLDAVSN